MGRTSVEFELSNYGDLKMVERGYLAADKVRKVVMTGIVDTGAARLVLPAGVCTSLGLPVSGQSAVRYADHRRETRDVVTDAHVSLAGREGVFHAIVEPARSDALVGAIVLEDLDLLVDSVSQRVIPRDPNTVLTEIE